jgi:hypothetical protein
MALASLAFSDVYDDATHLTFDRMVTFILNVSNTNIDNTYALSFASRTDSARSVSPHRYTTIWTI